MKILFAKIFLVFLLSGQFLPVWAQPQAADKSFLLRPEWEHASLGYLIKEMATGRVVSSYQPDRQLTPASVLKVLTTATALGILGEEYKYPTTLSYDGAIQDSVLQGNIYIKGHGDPTLGSSYFAPESKDFLPLWIKAIQGLGIKEIKGGIIADESIFDTEGVSMKWVREDLGSYYGAGSYGLNLFDNRFDLYIKSGAPGTRPQVLRTSPQVELSLHNYLRAQSVKSDSSYMVGMPFSTERFLYGVVPAYQSQYRLRGDIPEPALFLAEYLHRQLQERGIRITRKPSCYRQFMERGNWNPGERTEIITTYSPPLKKIIEKTNHVSHNLFADALLKTLGLRYQPKRNEVISSFGRGIQIVKDFWKKKGVDVSEITIYDGSGLAPANKVTAHFITDVLTYMATKSTHVQVFRNSLPQAGLEGSVRNFLKDTSLSGKAWLKSGSMSGVRCYAGYIQKNGKWYSVVLLANNFSGSTWTINRCLEKLLLE